MKKIILVAAVASLSLASCAGMKKSCCAVKPGAAKACCVDAKAKNKKCEACDKPVAKTETKKKA